MTLTFALQPASHGDNDINPPKGTRLITVAEMKLVDGVTIRYRRHWPLSFIEENVARCRQQKKLYTLLVVGGDEADPTKEAHLQKIEALIKTLAAKYAADPLCWGVHVTGCSQQKKPATKTKPHEGHSEELFWGRPMPAKVLDANIRLINAWANAFPRQQILLAGSANDPAAMQRLINQGILAAPQRFAYKINSLSPKTAVTGWAGTDLIVEAARLKANIAFEMLQPSNHSKFGGTWQQMLDKKAALEKRAGRKAIYVAVYKPDLAKAGGLK